MDLYKLKIVLIVILVVGRTDKIFEHSAEMTVVEEGESWRKLWFGILAPTRPLL
jgi:hypothetical protein